MGRSDGKRLPPSGIRTSVGVIGSLLLMGLLLFWVGPAEIWHSLRGARTPILILSFVFTPAVIFLKTLRWLLLARTQFDISFRDALRSYLAGLTLATLTPAAVGEAGRGLFVPAENRAGLTGKVILDKLVDLSVVSILASGGLILIDQHHSRPVGATLIVAIVASWAALPVVLPSMNRFARAGQGGWLKKLHIHSIIDGLASTRPGPLIANASLSFVSFAVYYLQAFVILRSFSADAPRTAVLVFPIITLSTILPLAIGGLGIREWAAIFLLARFGIAEAVAFNTFFAHFVIVQLVPALLGAAVIGSSAKNRRTEPPTPQEES